MTRAAAGVMVLTLASRMLGMIRDAAMSSHVGLQIDADAYAAAFRVTDFLNYLVAGGALSSTFVPVFTEYLKRRDEASAWKTFSVLLTVISIVGAGLVVSMEVFTPQVIKVLNWCYSPQKIALAVPYARILLPAQVCFLVGGLLMGTQNARGRFLIPALASCIYNVGSIVGLTVLYPWLGLAGGVWGAVTGAFIGCFLIQWIGVAQTGLAFTPSVDVRFPGVVRVWKLMLPILLGVALPNIDQLVTAEFAAQLHDGSQAALNAASRIMLIPVGIFAQAAGIALLPALSRLASPSTRDQFRATVNRSLGTVLFLTLPSSALIYLLAPEAISILNQHGAFTAADTMRAALPLRFYAMGIFAWSASTLLNRGFYALQDTKTPVISGTIATAVFVALSWMSMRLHWGTAGLALSTTIGVMLHVVLLYAMLRIRLRGIRIAVLSRSIVKTLLSTAMLSGAVAATVALAHHAGLDAVTALKSTALLAAGTATGLTAFALCAWALKMRELDTVKRASISVGRRLMSAVHA